MRNIFRGLHFHDLGLFVLQEVVDRLRVLVGQLLYALLRAMLVIAADVLELLEVVHRVTPHVSHRDLPLLREVTDDLDELLKHKEAEILEV